jgi:3-oxoacyl-[acyl-carrier-protein] synthase-3
VLFGDGAGAAVVKACDENGQGIIGGQIGSDGKKAAVLSCRSRTMGNFLTGKKPEPGYIVMEGQEVFKFAVKKVPECVETLMESMGIGMDEVKYLILHQANYRICESIARRLRISMDKIPMNIEKYGNTSGASIPLLLDELNREGKLKKGDKLVLAGFGAGLTWGAVLVEW